MTVKPATLERPEDAAAKPPFLPAGEYQTKAADFDYIEEEWFASGIDDAGRPYKTQIVVRLPRDPAKFSGTMLVEPLHVGRVAPIYMYSSPYMLRSGHGWACVASQKAALDVQVKPTAKEHYAGLHIETSSSQPPRVAPPGLNAGKEALGAFWDELARFNEASSAILAQAGAAIKAKAGPFAPYAIRNVLLIGHSQTGWVTSNYVFDAHASHRLANGRSVFDGYFPSGMPRGPYGPRDVPLIQLVSEGDMPNGSLPILPGYENRVFRRPDSDASNDRYRLYELASMPHMGTRYAPHNNPRNWAPLLGGKTDGVIMNSLPHHELFNAALDHLVQWVARGTVPPHAERIETDAKGQYFARDIFGNSRGGVRCAQIDVPHTTYHATPVDADGVPVWATVGTEVPFDKARMAALYGTPANYLARFETRLDELVGEGWLLAEDRPKLHAEAVALTW